MTTTFAPLPTTASASASTPSTTTESIVFAPTPLQAYLVRIGDTCLIHAQRLAEWSGHALRVQRRLGKSLPLRTAADGAKRAQS